MKALALLGGPRALWPQQLRTELRQSQARGDLLVGVDRGSQLLSELGFTPDLAVGDFDSLAPTELAHLEQQVADLRYSVPEKDLTDTELMLKYVFEDYRITSLTLYGATGGRLDHFLTNLFMVLKPEFSVHAEQVKIIDRQNVIRFYNPGKYQVMKEPTFTYFGVVPLMKVESLQITNAKYGLANFSTTKPISLSSNEFLPAADAFTFSFTEGVVAVVQSKDIDRYQNI